MNNRAKATSIPKKIREEVYARDKCCIICGSPNGVPNAHLVPRSQSGLGIKEKVLKFLDYIDALFFPDNERHYQVAVNVVTLCNLCHHEMDNGKNSLEIKEKVRAYLNRLYPEVTDEMRKYNKWRNEK